MLDLSRERDSLSSLNQQGFDHWLQWEQAQTLAVAALTVVLSIPPALSLLPH